MTMMIDPTSTFRSTHLDSTDNAYKKHSKRLSLQPPVGIPQLPCQSGEASGLASLGDESTAEDQANGHGGLAVDSKDAKPTAVPDSLVRRSSDASTASDASAAQSESSAATSVAASASSLGDEVETNSGADVNTLMGCMLHLSVSSLPPIPCTDEHGQSIPCGPLATRFPIPAPANPSSAIGTREEQRKVYLGPKLSDRATGGPDAGPLIERFSCLFKDQYHCRSNPKGIVSMGVAENFLMQEECIKLFSSALEQGLRAADLSYGDNLWGSRRINAALAGFYNQYFDPAMPVLPDHLITGNGCSAVLDQLFYSIMDEGEAVLVAAPYYTGFDRDLIPRARVRLVGVDVGLGDEAFGPECLEAFERKYQELKSQGVITRAVIVCNPQNPLGRTYPRPTLLAYAKWCEAKDIHLVSDEIYAMSVYDSMNPVSQQQETFTSMLSLRDEEIGRGWDRARLHVVYGMSKDFCANGLRVGSLVSQANPMLLRTMANTSMLMKISSPADIIWSHILTCPSTLSSFLAQNRRRLTEAHTFIRSWFESRGISVSYSNAGNFVWVKLGDATRMNKEGKEVKLIRSAAEEKRVFQRLLDGGVYIAPGMAYHCAEPGWFRVTFTIARDDLLVGLAKIQDILDLKPAHTALPAEPM